MAGKGTIRWREADTKNLRSVVSRFNAKVIRTSNKHPAISDLQPSKVNMSDLTEMLKGYNRKEFKRITGKMERYLRNGAEMPFTTKEGVNTTVWQKKEIDNSFRSINARRQAEIKKHNPSVFTGTMGTIEANNMKPRKNTVQSIAPKNWDKFVQNLEHQLLGEDENKKSTRYKENFLRAIEATIGENSRLFAAVSVVPASRLYQYYYTEPLLQISFTSDPKDAEEIEDIMLDKLIEVEGDVVTNAVDAFLNG